MTDEIVPDIAESAKNTVDNISTNDFAGLRLGQQNEQVEEQPQEEVQKLAEEEVETVEPTEEEAQAQPESEIAETESPDVLSKYSLDEMSEGELRELSEQLGSKAVARYGELTAKRKAAEEKLAELQSKLNNESVLSKPKEIKDNPYSDITKLEDLQKKSSEVGDIIEWAEDILFESDGYSADDVVTEVEGKEITKAQVRKSLLQARKSRDTFLPDQLNSIQLVEQSKQAAESFRRQAVDELPWLSGEDNDTRKRYEAMLDDKRFQSLQETVDPDISAQLPYIMAHAANSIYGRKLVEDSPSGVKLNPPKTSASSAPKVSRTGKNKKLLTDLSNRFKSTGNKDDYINFRANQLKNK
jgi:hypothetical protein